MLRIRDPGSGAFLPLDPRGKKSRSGNRDEHSGSFFYNLVYKFFGLKMLSSQMLPDPGSGTQDQGWKKPDPGRGMK